MVSPEDFLKFQIKSALNMAGVARDDITLGRIAEDIFIALFNAGTVAQVRMVLIDVEEQGKVENKEDNPVPRVEPVIDVLKVARDYIEKTSAKSDYRDAILRRIKLAIALIEERAK